MCIITILPSVFARRHSVTDGGAIVCVGVGRALSGFRRSHGSRDGGLWPRKGPQGRNSSGRLPWNSFAAPSAAVRRARPSAIIGRREYGKLRPCVRSAIPKSEGGMASFHENAKDCPTMGAEPSLSKCGQKSWTWQRNCLTQERRFTTPNFSCDGETTDQTTTPVPGPCITSKARPRNSSASSTMRPMSRRRLLERWRYMNCRPMSKAV